MVKLLILNILIVSLLWIPGKVNSQDETRVLPDNWIYFSDAPNALYTYLAGEATSLLQHRAVEINQINSLNAWKKRQEAVRTILSDIVGPFPERSPLNARVVRSIPKEGYRIEHVVFESQPGFYVTSSLFIPGGLKKNDKAPAIIYCSGHSAEGYRSAVYLHTILNLVKKGFVVFAFDPVGQGERLEYYDLQTGNSLVGGPTKEHSWPGAQAFISGGSQARVMIWDGIRAVDYLFTRKEVDTGRIGITGRSGGGTQSAYIAAMDERIFAAAPENYITNFTRLLQTVGPQDAEQNFFHGISKGIDHADLLLVRAPKPTLMITTTRDMFSIQGAMETEKEVSRIYSAFGQQDHFSRAEDDAGHESTRKNREALYAFFRNHLNNPGGSEDEEVEKPSADELKVTESGQVSVSLGGETVFSLNRKETGQRMAEWLPGRTDLPRHISRVLSAAKELSGFREPVSVDEPVFCGRFQREGYTLEKYYVRGEGDYIIPYLLMIPAQPTQKALILIHPGGKSAVAGKGGEAEKYVSNGYTVLVPDLIGTGETGPGSFKGDAFIEGTSHNVWYASLLTGRSITGIRAGDVIRLVMLLKRNLPSPEVYGLALGETGPVLLHAAALSRGFSGIALVESLSSYRSVVDNHFYRSSFIPSAVPGALAAYDLPDLAATLSPVKLVLANLCDGTGRKLTEEEALKEYGIVLESYRLSGAEEKLVINPVLTEKPVF